MARSRLDAGFTLAELTIVIVVVSIAALVFAFTFTEAVRTYRFISVEKELAQESRYAEERIMRELRRARGPAAIRTASPRAVAFVDVDSATVGISWSGVRGDDLVYSKRGVSRTLAGEVDSLAFGYWRADGTEAIPIVAPAATDVHRVTVFLRLARDGQSVSATGAALLRLM